METYTGRTSTIETVAKIEGGGISYVESWSHKMFDGMEGKIQVGDEVVVEMKGNYVTGVRNDREWLYHKSDQELEAERQASRENFVRERQKSLDTNREDWQRRTDALPAWIKARIENLAKGPAFEMDGWGYELCVAELAVIYAEHDLSEDDKTHPVWAYASEHGTSGNQHGMARALAWAHLAGEDHLIADSISALSPITGDPYYMGTR